MSVTLITVPKWWSTGIVVFHTARSALRACVDSACRTMLRPETPSTSHASFGVAVLPFVFSAM